MPDAQLNIVLTLVDEATAGVKKATTQLSDGLEKASVASKKLGSEINSVGRELTHIGATMTFIGASIQAVFVKAMNDSASQSFEVNKSLQILGLEFKRFELTISSAVVPVVNLLTGIFDRFNIYLDSIPKSLREQILQGIFLTGILITLGGVVTVVAGKIFALVGNLLKLGGTIIGLELPVLALYAGIASLILLMFRFESVGQVVMNTFEVLFNALKNGILAVKYSFETVLADMFDALIKYSNIISQIPSALGFAVKNMREQIISASAELRGFAQQDLRGVIDNAKTIGDIFTTGRGQWSGAFDGVRDAITKLIAIFPSLGTAARNVANTVTINFTQLITSTSSAFAHLSSSMQAFATEHKKFATAAKAIAIATATMNAAEGVTQIWAKWAAFPPVAAALTAIEVAATGLQIATIANQQFAEGTPSVPSDMVAQIHKNEMIIPATFSEGLRRGDVTLSGPNGGKSGGDIHINVYYPKMSSMDEVKKLANALGLEIDRQLNYVGS